MTPYFEELASDYPDLLFLSVDVDEVKVIFSPSLSKPCSFVPRCPFLNASRCTFWYMHAHLLIPYINTSWLLIILFWHCYSDFFWFQHELLYLWVFLSNHTYKRTAKVVHCPLLGAMWLSLYGDIQCISHLFIIPLLFAIKSCFPLIPVLENLCLDFHW